MASNKKMHTAYKKKFKSINKESGAYVSCATKHPRLPIVVGGTTYYVTGGSCVRRVPAGDYDVFIGLDAGLTITKKIYPWEKGVEFLYYIQDMKVPQYLVSFRKLLDYMEQSILKGSNVFVGCIGGHGRTGLVLAALVHKMTGKKDAITYVRENYCKKAVESKVQVNWLNKHFGINQVEASNIEIWGWDNQYFDMYLPQTLAGKSYTEGFSGGEPRIEHAGKGSIFGNAKITNIS